MRSTSAEQNGFSCKRKGGAFARRKFTVNSVRSPRKLSGTMAQICSRSRDGGPGHGRRGGGPGHALLRELRGGFWGPKKGNPRGTPKIRYHSDELRRDPLSPHEIRKNTMKIR